MSCDCASLTNAGLLELAKLVNVEDLTIARIPRITEKGLEFLPGLPVLHTCSLIGCRGVSPILWSFFQKSFQTFFTYTGADSLALAPSLCSVFFLGHGFTWGTALGVLGSWASADMYQLQT